MRSLTLSMAFFALMKLCGGTDEQTVVPPVGAAATGAITVTAQHGGVMVAASDDAWIELVTKQDGQVEAYVVDATGAPLPHDQAQVTTVQVQGSDGRPHDVRLAWDEPNRRYAGRVEVTPVAQAPAEVQLVVRGQPRRARAPQVVVIPPQPPSAVVVTQPPRPSASVTVRAPQPPSATVVVEAPQPPSATVVVEAPRPSVVVTPPPPPRAGVVVVAPPPPVVVAPPRPGVVVTAPTPRVGVVVEHDDHPGRGRGHAYGRRGREGGGTVVVAPPRPGAVVVAPPSPGRVEVRGGARVEARGGGGRVEVRGGGGHGRGRGRGRGDD